MSNDGEGEDQGGAEDTAGEVAETVGGIADTVSKAARGDAAGALQAGLGAAGGAAGIAAGALGDDAEEAREALRTAQEVANAGSSLIGAGRGLAGAAQSGSASAAAGALGSASNAARYIVPDREAQQVLSGVGQGAGAAQEGLGALQEAGEALSGGHALVEYHLEVADATDEWGIQHIALNERLNAVPRCDVSARYSGQLEARDLLHKEVTLTIERGSQRREFKGIVWHARVASHDEESMVHLTVTPAMAYLGERVDSHIYQDQTVVDVIKAVYQEMLGGLSRTVDDENLQRSYETREYIVQYQETHLAFISRLAEEEGIFWFFDHEADHEVLTLADGVSSLPRARDDNDGKAPFHASAADAESVFAIRQYESVGATDAVVADYDWSHPSLDVKAEQKGRSDHEPALEIFDHTDALIFHDFSGQYAGNTASVQAQLRAARLDLDRQKWELSTTIVSVQPGRTLEVEGAPDGSLDQRYVIVAASSQGLASEGRSGTWGNTLDVVPASMPYHPARTTPRPVLAGPELATVVGPSGSEIHTDEHGRVRVHFAWDRYHDKTAEDSSCWLRVVQSWAGPGFGTFFLPRVGMEVLVSFLGGNPDRPIVTACVYNGTNHAGVELDAKKTQSLIRTKSSPNSEGFNELRFEDKAGSEFIFTHAEKDYNEVVEHNHSTHVKNNQSNTVDANQTETVGANQTMTVHKKRTKTVDDDEVNTIHKNRTTTVDENDDETVTGNRTLNVAGDETIGIAGKRQLTVEGKTKQTHEGGREIKVDQYDILKVTANRTVHVVGKYSTKIDDACTIKQGGSETIYLHGHIYISSDSKLEMHAPGCMIKMEAGKISMVADNEIEINTGAATVAMKSDGTIEAEGATKVAVSGGGAMGEWAASGVKQTGNMVEIGADAVCKIAGTMVKIN